MYSSFWFPEAGLYSSPATEITALLGWRVGMPALRFVATPMALAVLVMQWATDQCCRRGMRNLVMISGRWLVSHWLAPKQYGPLACPSVVLSHPHFSRSRIDSG